MPGFDSRVKSAYIAGSCSGERKSGLPPKGHHPKDSQAKGLDRRFAGCGIAAINQTLESEYAANAAGSTEGAHGATRNLSGIKDRGGSRTLHGRSIVGRANPFLRLPSLFQYLVMRSFHDAKNSTQFCPS